MAGQLMTEEEFIAALRRWATQVQSRARMTLAQTQGTGNLSGHLYRYVDRLRHSHRVAFRFPQYGVFRHYGAGRGWVIVNGIPTRGERVWSLREQAERRTNGTVISLLKKGLSRRDIRSMKVTYSRPSRKPRTPLDWLDRHVSAGTASLADTAAAYYGDQALRNVLAEIDKVKIVKQ